MCVQTASLYVMCNVIRNQTKWYTVDGTQQDFLVPASPSLLLHKAPCILRVPPLSCYFYYYILCLGSLWASSFYSFHSLSALPCLLLYSSVCCYPDFLILVYKAETRRPMLGRRCFLYFFLCVQIFFCVRLYSFNVANGNVLVCQEEICARRFSRRLCEGYEMKWQAIVVFDFVLEMLRREW